jgi:hypothetical protein
MRQAEKPAYIFIFSPNFFQIEELELCRQSVHQSPVYCTLANERTPPIGSPVASMAILGKVSPFALYPRVSKSVYDSLISFRIASWRWKLRPRIHQGLQNIPNGNLESIHALNS